MGELGNLLVFQVEIDFTLPIDTHQLSVVNRVEVLLLLRVTMDGDNLTAKKSMVSTLHLGYHLTLISYGNPLQATLTQEVVKYPAADNY